MLSRITRHIASYTRAFSISSEKTLVPVKSDFSFDPKEFNKLGFCSSMHKNVKTIAQFEEAYAKYKDTLNNDERVVATSYVTSLILNESNANDTHSSKGKLRSLARDFFADIFSRILAEKVEPGILGQLFTQLALIFSRLPPSVRLEPVLCLPYI